MLNPEFLASFVEPLLIYGGGLSSANIQWLDGLHWIYNIASPGIALGTVGWGLWLLRRQGASFARDEIAALIFMSAFALLLSLKYVNQSLVALWQVNSWAFLVVTAWWLHTLTRGLPPFSIASTTISTRPFAANLLGVILVVFLREIDDAKRNPSLYAASSYRTYPSALNKALHVRVAPCATGRVGCSARPVLPEDVQLIQRLTQPGSRVAILDLRDWQYLIEAKRASKFQLSPSIDIFTRKQLEDGLEDLDLVFLPREPAEVRGIIHGDFRDALLPTWETTYELAGEGRELLAWKRRTPSP